MHAYISAITITCKQTAKRFIVICKCKGHTTQAQPNGLLGRLQCYMGMGLSVPPATHTLMAHRWQFQRYTGQPDGP